MPAGTTAEFPASLCLSALETGKLASSEANGSGHAVRLMHCQTGRFVGLHFC